MANEKPSSPTSKNHFAVAAGKKPILLLPFASEPRLKVEELISHSSEIDSSTLPRIVTEIQVGKLRPSHVLFTAVAVPTALGSRKTPTKFVLKISPGINVEQFSTADEDGFGGETNGAMLVDKLQKHVHPFTPKLTAEQILKILEA